MQLEGKSLRSDFIRFVTATSASLMVFSLYSMVDGLLVARGVGEYAMSAVNLAIPFTNALFSLSILFAVGASTIIAIFLGQGRKEQADRIFSQNIATLLVLGALITAAVFLFTDPFARLLGSTELTHSYVTAYLRGLAPFSACFIISYNLEILIKTDGYPKIALYTVITGCLANCVMDYIAIFWMDMGVFGAALATGLSQFLTCVIYFIHFFSPKCTFRLRKFRVDFKLYRRMLPIGFADGVTELCNGLMIFLFNRTVQKYIGADGVVSYTIIAYVNTLLINLMLGVGQGSQPLISYHYGKGDRKGSRTLLRYGLITITGMTAICFAGLYVFAPQLVQAYLGSASRKLIADSVFAFRRYSFSYLMLGFNLLIGGFMTALERPRPAICISVGRGFVFQSISLLTLAACLGGGAIWFAPVVSEAVCLGMAICFLTRYLKRNMAQS